MKAYFDADYGFRELMRSIPPLRCNGSATTHRTREKSCLKTLSSTQVGLCAFYTDRSMSAGCIGNRITSYSMKRAVVWCRIT